MSFIRNSTGAFVTFSGWNGPSCSEVFPNKNSLKVRMPSTKFPCGECKNECKDGSISCPKCGEWFHSVEFSGVQTNTLRAILKSPRLIWLCKTSVDSWKKNLKEGIRSDDPLAEELKFFEKRFTENQSTAKCTKMEQKIEEQLRKI